MKFLAVLSLFLSYIIESQSDGVLKGTFDVTADGKVNVYTKDMAKTYYCTFTYKARKAKTEEWHVAMEIKKFGESLACLVTRGKKSYLYFDLFSFALTGPGVAVDEFYAYDSDRRVLNSTILRMDKEANAVLPIKRKFRHNLESITIHANVDTSKVEW